jgi:AAA15 family ATPase/GTPase
MKNTSRNQKISELSWLSIINRNSSIMVDINVSRITLIGGLIYDTVPGIAETAGQASKSFTKVRPILPFTRRSSAWTSEQYNRVVKSTDTEMFLEMLQIADSSIKEVDIDINSEVSIYRAKGSERLVTADHVLQTLAQAAFSLINHKFLAIEQIENGLYISSYKDLWVHLFEMSALFEAQIIATTHSTKMIKAFAEVSGSLGKDEYYSSSSYVELARKEKSNELVTVSRDADTVLYALEHSKDVQGGCSIGS